jgi:renalase
LSDSYQKERYGPFDWVVSSAPAPQTQVLFPQDFAEHELIENKKMQGCYSLMLGFPEDLKLNWNAAKIKNSPIGWIAVNSSKPLRDSGYSLLVQTTNEWAESNIETDQNSVQALLIEELGTLLQRNIRDAVYTNLHRWRYANTVFDEDLENNGYCMDEKLQLAACGDWCIGSHVESAYLSGCALSLALKKNIKWK